MRPRLAIIAAAALAFVCCDGITDQAAAKVIHTNKAAPSNPAVEVGGLRLRRGALAPPVQYSLVGAIALSSAQVPTQYSMAGVFASQGRWLTRCAFWPWGVFNPLSFHRQSFHRFGPFGPAFFHPRPFGSPHRPPIGWMLTPLP